METKHALTLAQDLIRKHNLNLKVTLSKTKSALGRCLFWAGEPVKIELSAPWVEVLDEADVRDTILHEIAHAIAGAHAGHGLKWQATAMRIGARPKTCAKIDEHVIARFHEKNSKYKANCPCGYVNMYFNRMGKNWKNGVYQCAKCRKQATVTQLR